MVGMLLDHGADVNAVDNDGDTALHITLMKEGVPQGIMGLMVNKFTKFNLSIFFCLSAWENEQCKMIMK